MADGGERIDGQAIVEMAARHLAAWRSVGSAWWTADYTFAPEFKPAEDDPAASPGLAVAREAETLMRARDSTSALPEGVRESLQDDELAELHEWERQNPLNKGEGRNPRRTREFECWRRAVGVLAVPRTRPSRTVAAALSFASLQGPLEALLLLYACEDWEQWPKVRRYALACMQEPEAVEDAMQRILWRRASVSQDERAKQLGRRAVTYRQQTAQAQTMLEGWLHRAAQRFMHALHGTDLHPPKAENCREAMTLGGVSGHTAPNTFSR